MYELKCFYIFFFLKSFLDNKKVNDWLGTWHVWSEAMTGISDQLSSVRVAAASHCQPFQAEHGYTFKLPLPSCLTHLPPPAQLRFAFARRPSLAVSANRPTAGPKEVKECAGQHVYNDRVPRLDRATQTHGHTERSSPRRGRCCCVARGWGSPQPPWITPTNRRAGS